MKPAATGMHLHAALRGWAREDVRRVVEEAEALGVGVTPDEPFCLRPRRDPGLLLGFWGLSAERIREGVARLTRAIERVRR